MKNSTVAAIFREVDFQKRSPKGKSVCYCYGVKVAGKFSMCSFCMGSLLMIQNLNGKNVRMMLKLSNAPLTLTNTINYFEVEKNKTKS